MKFWALLRDYFKPIQSDIVLITIDDAIVAYYLLEENNSQTDSLEDEPSSVVRWHYI